MLFEFAALSYFEPSDSYIAYVPGTTWDFAPQTLVQKVKLGSHPAPFSTRICTWRLMVLSAPQTPDGNYLASYHHLSSVILVNGSTSVAEWVMGASGISSGTRVLLQEVLPPSFFSMMPASPARM